MEEEWFQGTKLPRLYLEFLRQQSTNHGQRKPGGFRNVCLYPVDSEMTQAKTEKYVHLQRVAVKRDCSQFRHIDKQLIYDDDATHDDQQLIYDDDAGDMSPSCQPAQKRVRHFLSRSVVNTDNDFAKLL